jgi:hypothetical protein
MWCPTCRGEFVDEVTVCPDCEVPLVEQMPEGEDPDEPFVQVFRTADTSLLPVVKSVLGGAGIPHIVQGDEAQGLYPFGSVGGGSDDRLLGAVVLVPESRREAAEAVLEELEGLAVESEDAEADDDE